LTSGHFLKHGPNLLVRLFDGYNFLQLINEPTRITENSQTLIDLILVCNINFVTSTKIIHTHNISDHAMVMCETTWELHRTPLRFTTSRSYRDFNYNNFLTDLMNLDWREFLYAKNVNDKVKIFNYMIISLFDIHAPLRTIRITKPKAPWLTEELKALMKQRDKALQTFKKSPTNNSWLNYKVLRNRVVKSVRLAKQEYIQMLCDSNESHKLHKFLKPLNIYNSNSPSVLPHDIKDVEELRSHFINSVQCQTSTCDGKIEEYKNSHSGNATNFEFSMCTEQEIHDTLIYLKSNDTGHDAVNLKMLKLCSPHIDKYILHLLNFCIQNSSFPDMWKIAIGCPIPKCPKPQKYSDIRMISILLTLSKIFEKILLRQISGYVDEHHLIPGTQNGFRPGFNTGFALAATLDDIIFSLDKNMISILVLSTFDTISHDLSYAKLKYYGFAQSK
jgi:hypothetical protein